MSKLIKYPQFSPLPPSTDAANVVENIKLWIEKGKEDKLKLYCRPDNSEIGYRFIEEGDFLEKREEEQVILGCKVKLTFTRYVGRENLTLYPLCFCEYKTYVDVHYNGKVHAYKNDNQLKIFLRRNTPQ